MMCFRKNKQFLFVFNYFFKLLDLHYCAQVFSRCSEQGLLFVVVNGLLLAVASLAVGHGLSSARPSVICGTGAQYKWSVAQGLSSCGIQPQLLGGMWSLLRPGIEPILCIGRQIVIHCTTREVQNKQFWVIILEKVFISYCSLLLFSSSPFYI